MNMDEYGRRWVKMGGDGGGGGVCVGGEGGCDGDCNVGGVGGGDGAGGGGGGGDSGRIGGVDCSTVRVGCIVEDLGWRRRWVDTKDVG